MTPRLLIVGVGNVLRGDDGFGIEVAHRLQTLDDLPGGVKVIETGIGGISFVQELMDGYDALLLLDAVDRDGEPGHLYLLDTDVPDLGDLDAMAQQDFLADVHFANPDRALMMAKALGVLPPRVHVLGCQSASHDDFVLGMSEAVCAAVPKAVERALAWIEQQRRTAAPS